MHSQNAENCAIIQNVYVLISSQVLIWLYALSCCSHILIEADKSAPSHSCLSSILPLKCVKISWFPSLLSYSRRNFLLKHFTFLATGGLLVQPQPVCFSLLSVYYSNMLVALWKRGGGQDCTPSWKVFAELVCRERACAKCSCWIPHKGKKGLFPRLYLILREQPDSCVGGYWGLS